MRRPTGTGSSCPCLKTSGLSKVRLQQTLGTSQSDAWRTRERPLTLTSVHALNDCITGLFPADMGCCYQVRALCSFQNSFFPAQKRKRHLAHTLLATVMPLPQNILRTMTVIRSGTDLCLVNSVRLDTATEAELLKLGSIKHLVSLGSFHGVDDPWYVDTYHPRHWSVPGAEHHYGLKARHPPPAAHFAVSSPRLRPGPAASPGSAKRIPL